MNQSKPSIETAHDVDVRVTDRIQRMTRAAIDAVPQLGIERAKWVTKAYRATEHLSTCVYLRRAKALESVLDNMTISIEEDTLLVGNHTECGVGKHAPLFPEATPTKDIAKELLDGDPYFPWSRPYKSSRYDAPHLEREQFQQELREILPYWEGKSTGEVLNSLMREEIRKSTGAEGIFIFDKGYYFNAGDGHFVPDYAYLFTTGLRGVVETCRKKISDLDRSVPGALEKEWFWQSVIITNEAVIRWAKRYSRMAQELAIAEKNTERRSELQAIASACEQVPEGPPRTFAEALQFILFVHLAISIEDAGHSISFGRADQYLHSFYASDVAKGTLDENSVIELLLNWMIKVWEVGKYRPYFDSRINAGKPMHQHLTVGGQKVSGGDACNELTYLWLKARQLSRVTEPQFGARIHKGSPTKYLLQCARSIRTGIGQPALFNDTLIIPALLGIGYEIDEAYDYHIIGCTEPHPPGVMGGGAGGPIFNIAKIVELAMFDGKDPITGIRLHGNAGGKDLSSFASFKELWTAVLDQMNFYLKLMNEMQNLGEIVFEKLLDEPFAASTGAPKYTLERGKGFKRGGTKYSWLADNVGGIATAGNSLMSIKRLVFDEKKITGAQLKHALETDFEDLSTNPSGEAIRAMCVESPKFGNDIDEVDFIVRDLLLAHCRELKKFRIETEGKGPLGNIVLPSSNSVTGNVAMGYTMSATPDGRKAKQPPSEAASAAQGALGPNSGFAAYINSISKIRDIEMVGGQLRNFSLTPQDLQGDIGLRKFVDYVKTFIDKQGFHMQFNVVDAKTLLDAKKNPDKYRNLMVRVAAYSAYFVDLAEEIQDDIISRVQLRLT